MQIKQMIESIAHVRSIKEFIFNSIITLMSFTLGYFKILYLDNYNLFFAILIVVVIDWLFGVALALKNKQFETQKALKIVYYLVAYWLMLIAVLSIETGYPTAFWLSEAIIMPILVFQIISMIKNLILLGIINNSLAKEMFKNIDKYKEQMIDKNIDKIKEAENENI